MSRWKLAGLALLVVAVVAAALMAARGPDEVPAEATDGAGEAARDADIVVRRTLEEKEEFSGTLGYGDQFALPGLASGTVSWVPDEGAVLQPGDMLYRVDEQPTYWVSGAVPMFRELSTGAEGTDVEQLQRHLQETGYLDLEATIDGKYGRGTRNAVKAWQDDHGLEKTGRIDGTQLLFLPYESIRVAAAPRVGAVAGGGVLEVTEPDLYVTVDTGVRKKKAFEGRPEIEVETADGERYTATVQSMTPQQSQDSFGGQIYRIRLEVDGAGGLNPGEVSVAVVDVLAENVLTVPARALVALVEGGYAVEVPDGTESSRYVGVAIGAFADGWVEVTGELAEGDQVVVPE